MLLAVPAQAAASLREVLDRAWQRAVPARLAESRLLEARAAGVAAASLLAEAPSVGMAVRDDRFNRNLGKRETELELALPLSLPGQRAARQALAARDLEGGEVGLTAARLTLAGEVRDAVWAYATARAEADLARQRAQLADALTADVERREAAGDLARTDLLLAREDTLAARILVTEAASRERQALERYRLLSGEDSLPTRFEEDVMALPDTPHPRRSLALAAVEQARAEMHWVRETPRAAPELSLGWQQSREDFAAREQNSLRLGLRIPLASEVRNAPRVAAANSALIRAEAELRQVIAELDANQREARAMLEHAAQAEAAARERAALAADRVRLLERAFALGELALVELVRARGIGNQALLDATRATLALASARARLNQAMGVLP